MKKYNNISEIPSGTYEGYIWEADEKHPRVIDEFFDFTTFEPKSYIIEALLFNRKDKKSIHIRHSGKEHIHEFDLNNVPEENLKKVEYLPHRLDGIGKVCFKQLWLPEEDENCEKWPVLKMKALVFTGFVKN